MIIGQLRSFVDPGGLCRTPEGHPYSYDPYFLWKEDKDLNECEVAYDDRLMLWDGDKFEKSRAKATEKTRPLTPYNPGRYLVRTFNQQEVSIFLSEYFSRSIKAKAMAIGCNQATGNPYLVFWFNTEECEK